MRKEYYVADTYNNNETITMADTYRKAYNTCKWLNSMNSKGRFIVVNKFIPCISKGV